jgi:DNA-binding protein YbaB
MAPRDRFPRQGALVKAPETFDDVLVRFPVLDVVIRNLTCNEADKEFLRQLFLEVYRTAVEDVERRYEEES